MLLYLIHMLINNKLIVTTSPVKIVEIESYLGMSFMCHLNIWVAPKIDEISTHRYSRSSVSYIQNCNFNLNWLLYIFTIILNQFYFNQKLFFKLINVTITWKVSGNPMIPYYLSLFSFFFLGLKSIEIREILLHMELYVICHTYTPHGYALNSSRWLVNCNIFKRIVFLKSLSNNPM